MSRIGRKPIVLPEGTTLELKGDEIIVSGQKGTLSRRLLEGLAIDFNERTINIRKLNEEQKTKGYYGLMRTLINNMVEGVHNGFEKKLEIVGIGYRAEIQGNLITFYLGYSHPIKFPLPEGISGQIEKQTLITVRGINKELLGETAAKIRMLRKPDVYKNKGIKYANEVLRRKAGKSGKK